MGVADVIAWSELLRFQPHPDVWALVVGLGVGYAVTVRRHHRTVGETTPRRTVMAFASGLLVLWIASDWPIDDIGERSLLSVHMVQYLLLAMVAPGLLLLGLPRWLLDRLLAPRWVRSFARVAARPWTAWLIFNAVLLLSHWNPVIALYLANNLVHLLMHIAWVGSGFALWWPVLAPLPDVRRPSPPGQMGYLLVQSVLATIPATFLTFGAGAVFPAYAALPKPPGIDVVTDQQVAGLLMKIGGGVILWIAVTIIFFRWSSRETAVDSETGAVR